MTNRRERRAQRATGPRPTTWSQRRTGLRVLVLIAVVGLVMLAVASLGAANVAAPTASPLL